jgi:ATP-dependent Clp protease ATP-binding subunit ClpA
MPGIDAIRMCSKDARLVIADAAKICEFMGHPSVRPEHLMLSLLKYHKGKKLVGIRNANIGVGKLINSVYALLPPYNPVKSSLFKKEGEIGQISRIKSSKIAASIITMSLEEARRLKCEVIEPDHLLMAVLSIAKGSLRQLLEKAIPHGNK